MMQIFSMSTQLSNISTYDNMIFKKFIMKSRTKRSNKSKQTNKKIKVKERKKEIRDFNRVSLLLQ